MRIFISGGCKNGKSTCALNTLAVRRIAAVKQKKNPSPLYYIATMTAKDNEDNDRITKHQRDREGCGFITIEQPACIEDILQKCDCGGSFLLDSLTALLANEMFPPSGIFDKDSCERVASGIQKIFNRIQNIVIVSDFIYSDAFIYDSLTETYRKSLAFLDKLAAKNSDVVIEAAYAQIIAHKGADLFRNEFGGKFYAVY